jgi:hypothetical protein
MFSQRLEGGMTDKTVTESASQLQLARRWGKILR